MKKVLFTVLALVALLSSVFSPLCVSAATKEDVLNEFGSIPASRYVYDEIEQLANNHPLTSEQYDKLLEWCKELKTIIPEDKGRSFHSYPDSAQEKMIKMMNDVADYLGLRIETVPSDNPIHRNDVVIYVYDSNDKMIFRYDGDEIQKTDTVDSSDSANYVLYAVISASLIVTAFVVFVFVSKKRHKNIEA